MLWMFLNTYQFHCIRALVFLLLFFFIESFSSQCASSYSCRRKQRFWLSNAHPNSIQNSSPGVYFYWSYPPWILVNFLSFEFQLDWIECIHFYIHCGKGYIKWLITQIEYKIVEESNQKCGSHIGWNANFNQSPVE